MTALEQLVLRVGLVNVPHLQPKQLSNAGVREFVRVLTGVRIQLVQSEDDDSDTSEMYTFHASLLLDRSETDPLALNQRNPDREDGALTEQSSSPDAMDQDDVLGHDTYLDRDLASDTGAAPGRISGFHSEEMDTTAQPSEVESCSDRPMESQDAQYIRSGPDSNWGEGESEMARRRRLYPKVPPYVIPVPPRINSG